LNIYTKLIESSARGDSHVVFGGKCLIAVYVFFELSWALTLPYYAMLRLIPTKLVGVLAMFGSLGVLVLVSWSWTFGFVKWVPRVEICTRFQNVSKVLVWIFLSSSVLLG
jgi:quinol-cytochrome oxidoreductase complex cytochrome b subunit